MFPHLAQLILAGAAPQLTAVGLEAHCRGIGNGLPIEDLRESGRDHQLVGGHPGELCNLKIQAREEMSVQDHLEVQEAGLHFL